MANDCRSGLYLLLISIHGLIRARDLELGRDADTGGQTKYVVDLARALAQLPEIKQVDLVTRRIVDASVDGDYAEREEPLCDNAKIARIDAGPDEYLPKEQLWDYLDIFIDHLWEYLQHQPKQPDILHSHYADAGYVATRLSHLSGIPVVHTGHSLGRDKRRRLLAAGLTAQQLDDQYNINRRIEAEEEVLANASLVITSTHHEIAEQYELYDFYRPDSMQVIPPGTNLQQFHPPQLGEDPIKVSKSIRRFLDEPDKPMILTLSRPDPRKNIATLITAYGESKALQDQANLVIIAGNRSDIRKMEDGPRSVLTELLVLIDFYDLYGKVAIPKQHLPEEVPAIYRLAANSRGVFVNPALTEPFGLTLLEAAASGLPFIATENGGPVDIVKNCQCGVLVDPLDAEAMREAIKNILFNGGVWRKNSSLGIKNVATKYSWQTHARKYLAVIQPIIESQEPVVYSPAILKASPHVDRLIVSDLDKTLLSDTQGLKEFTRLIRTRRNFTAFGIATARRLDSVLVMLKKYDIPMPDILITSLGTEIYYSQALNLSTDWAKHVDHHWNPKAVRRILAEVPGLTLQEDREQSEFKISYYINSNVEGSPDKQTIVSLLRQEEQSVNVFLSQGQNLDITPVRASKGLALRYVAKIWNIPMEHILVAGGSGTDEDMMVGSTLSVVVSNRQHEALEYVHNEKHIYLAKQPNAKGILEAIEYYQFFSDEPGALAPLQGDIA